MRSEPLPPATLATMDMAPGTITHPATLNKNPTGYSQVLDELVNGAVTKTYTYGLQRISENQLSGSTWTPTFYGYDGHGNVRFTTSTAGAVGNSYQFDAFGAPIASTGTIANTYLYSGERFDSNLNLYQLRARFYNMLTGRFETLDPAQHKSCKTKSRLWTNAYAFVSDDPVNRFDPTGRAEAVAEYAIDLRGVLLTAWVGIQIYEHAVQEKLKPCDLEREQWVPGKGVRCHYNCGGLGTRCIDFPDAEIGVNHCPFDSSPEFLEPCDDMDPLE